MKATIAAVGVAFLLVTAGAAAAAPENTPDVSNADEPDGEHNNETEDTVAGDVGSDDDEERRPAHAGPPGDLPDAIPDGLTEVQDAVGDTLDGVFDGDALGDSIPGVGR